MQPDSRDDDLFLTVAEITRRLKLNRRLAGTAVGLDRINRRPRDIVPALTDRASRLE